MLRFAHSIAPDMHPTRYQSPLVFKIPTAYSRSLGCSLASELPLWHPFWVQSSCSSTDFKKSPTPTNPSAYFATGFRYVGIRKIMTFPGLFRPFCL